MELRAPMCQQQAGVLVWGHTEMLTQEWAKCIHFHFPFLIDIPGSCWLSWHNSIAAVSADPLNVTFLATQRPCYRPWESLRSIWGVTMDFPSDAWQIAYLFHCKVEGTIPPYPSSGPFASLYTMCIVSPSLCSTLRGLSQLDSSSLPAMTMSNDERSLSRHLMCKGVFHLGITSELCITIGTNIPGGLL